MKQTNKRTGASEKLVTLAILTALVIVLQSFSSVAARIGLFSFALGGLPVAIGAILYGNRAGAWLGAVFGAIVLATDATAFALYGVNVFATVAVVLLKSIASGLAMSLTFKLCRAINRYVGVVVASIVGPVVNTGIFVAGVCIFFEDFFSGFVADGVPFVVGLILMLLVNFFIEIAINVVFAPVVYKIVGMRKKAN